MHPSEDDLDMNSKPTAAWGEHPKEASCLAFRTHLPRAGTSLTRVLPPRGRMPPVHLGWAGKTPVHDMSSHSTARRASQEVGTVGWGLLGPWGRNPPRAWFSWPDLVFADHARSSLGSMPLQVSA